jgi:hypothetical protein
LVAGHAAGKEAYALSMRGFIRRLFSALRSRAPSGEALERAADRERRLDLELSTRGQRIPRSDNFGDR